MKKSEFQTMLNQLSKDIEFIKDEKSISTANALINLAKTLADEKESLLKEKKNLIDEISNLKFN